jgi:hypothetical protein
MKTIQTLFHWKIILIGEFYFVRKATDPEEVARIAKAGGFVVNGRVLGSLAISRYLFFILDSFILINIII